MCSTLCGVHDAVRLHPLAQDEDSKVQKEAFVQMRTTICAATSTMTSVPKPLKFLLPHYQSLKEAVDKITDADAKVRSHAPS